MKPISLPSQHYASTWKTDTVKTTDEVSALGRRYAEAPDEIAPSVSNPVKQAVLLEICQAFHPYLMKYLTMICRGQIPYNGHNINKDFDAFIRHFLPKGAPVNLTAHFARFHPSAGLESQESQSFQ